jgi:coproporphyrinogen III oxidase-like Fe-S oxidoreductase
VTTVPNWTWKPVVHLAVTGHLRALRLRPLDPPRPKLTNLGLYLHVPFCKKLCPFCPYHRVRYEPPAFASFERAVKQEIDLCAGPCLP